VGTELPLTFTFAIYHVRYILSPARPSVCLSDYNGYSQTDRQMDGRATVYSEREREFAKNAGMALG